MGSKYHKYLIFVVTITLGYGCSYKGNSSRSEKVYLDNRVVIMKDSVKIVQPEYIDNSQIYFDVRDKYLKNAKIEAKYSEISNFTNLEQAHVSISNSFNPFTDTNTIIIDLDELKKDYTYPVDGALISDYGIRSGRMHSGVDIKLELGDKIYALLDGVVRMSKNYGDYGNVVVLRHTNGIETVYSHNSKNLVKVGERVKQGDAIALGGKTGRATTTHVHFEVRSMGKVINPHLLINTTTRQLESGILVITYNNSLIKASKGEATKSSNTTAKKEESSDESSKKQGIFAKTKVHTIKKGDTLYSIARANNTTVDELCKINNIKKTAILHIGQQIKLN
ncbi:MAG: M23 family metallopeptidase [Rikenellaceae bacterium]